MVLATKFQSVISLSDHALLPVQPAFRQSRKWILMSRPSFSKCWFEIYYFKVEMRKSATVEFWTLEKCM